MLNPEFKTNLLFKSRSSQVPGRLLEMFSLSGALLDLVAEKGLSPGEISLLRRFLNEQALYDAATKSRSAKENKDIAATFLQSAYDPDATFRNKGGKVNKGYILNMAETCADENPVQLVTDYTIKNSSVSDTGMLLERLPEIKNNTDITDLYVDGAYYSEDVETHSQAQNVDIHYTDMTGKAPNPEKIPLTEFAIDTDFNVLSCPENHPALKSKFKKDSGIVSAHFSLEHCQQCPRKDNCPVKLKKTSAVLHVKKNAVLAAYARERTFAEPLRKEATSKRAAAEGSISAVKRAQGAGKLKVRTHPKVKVVMGFKMLGRNIRQMVRFFQGKIRKHAAVVTTQKVLTFPAAVITPTPIGVVCTF